jgi:hypothetical protein
MSPSYRRRAKVLRRHPVQISTGAIIHAGGHAQIATVRANGIVTKILRRWPEPVVA